MYNDMPNANRCPEDVRDSLNRYVVEGIPTGDFLRAVLANDLMESIGRADVDNLKALPHICAYIYNYLPMNCIGSYQRVNDWLAVHEKALRLRKEAEDACQQDAERAVEDIPRQDAEARDE